MIRPLVLAAPQYKRADAPVKPPSYQGRNNAAI